MSEPKDINDSEQEMHEVMDEENDKFDGGAGAGAQGNPSTMEEKHSTLSAEPQEGTEIPTANDSIEDHDSDTKTNDNEEVAELGNGGLENGNEMSVDVEEKEVHAEDNQFDKTLARMDEKRPELGKGELENGNKLVDAEEKEIHPEKNQVDETALIEEGSGEDPAQSPDFDPFLEGDDDGTEEQQAAFMRALENFHKEMRLEFKPPKFYGEGLNCLKLWRAVTRLGGYDQVTSCKLWRQVGESFKPPKTCTTIAWSFRSYYEHALLEYEKHKISTGKFHVPLASLPKPMPVDNQVGGNHASGSGRARWDAAERAMQGWHSQRLLSNGKVGDPIIKDKTSVLKQDKYHKSIGTLKRKKASSLEHAVKASHKKVFKPQVDAMVVDDGQPADWVKINLKRTHTHTQIQPSVPTLSTPVAQDSSPSLVVSAPSSDPSGLKFKLPRQLSDLSAEQIHAWLSEMEVSGQADLYNQLLFLCALVEDFHSLSHEVSSATSATLEKIQEEVTRNRAQQEEFDKSISLAELKVAELKTAISQAENEVMELRRQRATLMLPDPQYIQELQREVAKQKVLDRISKVKAVALEVAYEQFFLNLD